MSKRRRISLTSSVAALTALAGCSLATDLDSLSARRRSMDAAVTSPDAGSTADVSPGGGAAPDAPQAPQGGVDAPAAAADVAVMDTKVPEDRPQSAVDDAASDGRLGADATEPYDVAVGNDGGGNAPPPPPVDAAPIPDGQGANGADGSISDGKIGDGAIVDGTIADGDSMDGKADARPPMCPRSPSHDATLYLADNMSATTGCGYTRSGLSGAVASVDSTSFAAAAACGACVRIETPAAAVVAAVVEQGVTPTAGNPTALAVNRAALRTLVPDGSTFVEQGVAWRFVQCPLPADAGMTFSFQEGSSANYAALLIQRHRFRLASVEYRANGGYRSLTRTSYNYWVATNGMGGGPFTLRVTDVHGHSVEQTGVPLKPGVIFQGQVQFPACANE